MPRCSSQPKGNTQLHPHVGCQDLFLGGGTDAAKLRQQGFTYTIEVRDLELHGGKRTRKALH